MGPNQARAILLTVFLCIGSATTLTADAPTAPGGPLFVYGGHALAVDFADRGIIRVARFAPGAPTAAWGPNGRVWGRGAEGELAAVDGFGRRVGAVDLPYRPYHFVVGAGGCAYVTHQTLTAKEFSLSVVDLARGRLRTVLDGVKGIRTDIGTCGSAVFLATVGVRPKDYLLPRLYRIEKHGKALSLLAEGSTTRVVWSVACLEGRLFVLEAPTKSGSGPGRLFEMDPRTGTHLAEAAPSMWAPAGLPVRLAAGADGLVLVCRSPEERFRVVSIDPGLGKVLRDHPLPGPVHSVVGIDDSLMAYLDYPPFGGAEDQSLCFFDLGAGREVTRLSVAQFLQGLE